MLVYHALLIISDSFAFEALASVLVKKFYLVVEITNHDTQDWVTSDTCMLSFLNWSHEIDILLQSMATIRLVS